jgi:Domain of unknown function (DUF4145)
MQKIAEAHCNKCGGSRNHDVVAAEKQEDTDEEDGSYWCDLYEMLKCRGCESVTMRCTSQRGRDRPPIIVYYPPAIARRAPSWVNYDLFDLFSDVLVPAPICALMREVYTAVQNDSRRLAAMGIRAALESVMIEKVGDQGKFKANVDALQQAGYLSVRQALSLDSILEAGHAAIHRGWEPTNADIVTLLDITESIMEVVYLHEHRARDLDNNIPKRCSNTIVHRARAREIILALTLWRRAMSAAVWHRSPRLIAS